MVVNSHQPGEPERGRKRATVLSSCVVEKLHLNHVLLNNRATSRGNNLAGEPAKGCTHIAAAANSVKSQSTKRQAFIGKQALLVWLLME